MNEHIEIFKPNRDRDIQCLLAAKELEKRVKGKLKRVKIQNGYACCLDANKWEGLYHEKNRSFGKQVERTDPTCGASCERFEQPGQFEGSGFGEITEKEY